MSRIAGGLALFAALALASGPPALARQARTVTVQILAINDLHGNLEPPTGAEGLVGATPAGGAEYLAAHLDRARRANPNTLIVAAGDLIGASPLTSGLFHDAPTIEAVNAMGLAVSAIGNHELDDGTASLLARLKGGCPRMAGCAAGETSPPARFRYLAANVVRSGAGGATLFPATAVLSAGGVRIGFIGETLQATGSMIRPAASAGLDFLDESAAANTAAARLRRRGVHAIILLIHQGGAQMPADRVVDPDGCDNFEGPIRDVLAGLSPSIRVVVSGHTHQAYNCRIDGRTVTSASAFGRLFTTITLSIDPRNDRIVRAAARNVIVTRDLPKDPAQTAILERYRPEAARLADRAVGVATAVIDRTPNAAGESALGDVIADAHLAATSAPDQGGAQVAFINSGGIRAVITGAASADGRRAVSYGDVYTAQPFADHLTLVTLTGDMIRRLLEQQFQRNGKPDILQVSRGFTYRYRLDAPPGQHVVAGSIALNGRTLGADDAVRVETTGFLIEGGDGLTVFHEGRKPEVGPLDVDAVAQYFESYSPVSPGPQDRIVRID